MRKEVKEILNNKLYLIVFALGFLVLEYYQRYRLISMVYDFNYFEGLSFVFSITFVTFLCLILVILPYRYKPTFIILSYVSLVTFLISNSLYHDMFNEFLSVRQMAMVKEAHNYYNRAGDFILDTYKYARFDYLVLITVGVTTIISTIKLLKKNTKRNKRSPLIVILLVFLFGSNIIGVSTINNSKDSKWQIFNNKIYLYDTLFRKDYAIEQFGIYGYLKRDVELAIKNTFNITDPDVIEEIDEYFEENQRVKNTNEYTGIFEDKNLVFILAESLNGANIESGLMPTLEMMKNEGMYFDNFYIPAYPRTTCDSEFIFQTGVLPSLYSGPTCYFFEKNELPNTLPRLFIDKGYQANSFHNNTGEFYNRYDLHESFGFENFYDSEKLNMDLLIDSNIYELAKEELLPKDDKFYSFIISYSGHGDYTESDLERKSYYQDNFEKAKEVLGEDTPYEILVNHAFQMELDTMLSKLYSDLEDKGELEDTVFVIIPDHYPYLLDKQTYKDYYNMGYPYEYHHLPLIIYNTEIEPQTISSLGSTVDVLPTIANMFNLDYDPNNYFGSDIMDVNYEPVVFFKDYSWINKDNFYSPTLITGDEKPHEYYQRINDYLYKRIDIFQKMLIEDYYKK